MNFIRRDAIWLLKSYANWFLIVRYKRQYKLYTFIAILHQLFVTNKNTIYRAVENVISVK